MSGEWDRAKDLDEKLFKVTTALSVAVTAAGVASKTVLDTLSTGPVKVGITAVLLYSIGSLFAGVLMGFAGLRPKERAGYGPDFALQIRHDNQAAAEAIADALMHFEVNNLVRSNEATAANMAIRNGVIAFALAMTCSLFIPSQKVELSNRSNGAMNVSSSSQVSAKPPASEVSHSAMSAQQTSLPADHVAASHDGASSNGAKSKASKS